MRGEHFGRGEGRLFVRGSSPHARGALRARLRPAVRQGLIPACAGSTAVFRLRYWPTRAHPRMRGEHFGSQCCRSRMSGSSPHARGALGHGVDGALVRGLIPACAGSTCAVGGCLSITGAHPRMRGEHAMMSAFQSRIAGSSPHARGAPGSATASTPTPTAHPRMRGEHWRETYWQRWAVGSSPHARGARARRWTGCRTGGLIPACAGSTPRHRARQRVRRAHPRMRGEHRNSGAASFAMRGSSPHARGAHFLTCMFSAHHPSFHSLSPNSRARNPPPDTPHLRRPA